MRTSVFLRLRAGTSRWTSTAAQRPRPTAAAYTQGDTTYTSTDRTARAWTQTSAQPRNARQQAVSYLGALVPDGFPGSVRSGYGDYAGWQAVGSVASTAGGVLSMQCLLQAVGVGSAAAAPMSAALNWVIKDGLGQLGGIAFAAAVHTRFDDNPRKWRMASSLALDLSTALELMTPLAPAYFVPIAGVANVGKNVAWLSASASRAAIHDSFVRHNNLGDVTAKAGSQTITASLLGTAIGIGVSPLLGGEWSHLVGAFAVFSSVHLASCYMSLRGVATRNLNASRLGAVAERFLSGGGAVAVASPRDIAADEEMATGAVLGASDGAWLEYGAALPDVAPTPAALEALRTALGGERYLLAPASGQGGGVRVLFFDDAAPADVLRAALHAHLLRGDGADGGQEAPAEAVARTRALLDRDGLADRWLEGLAGAGWKTDALGWAEKGRVAFVCKSC